MNVLFRTLLICSLILTIPVAGMTGIYKYRDANGQLHFVDDESRVPAEFRDDMTSISESQESLTGYGSQNNRPKSVATPLLEQKKPDSRATKKKRRAHQTPVEIKGNRVLVPVEVAYGNRTTRLNLLLDTGASRTLFHSKALARLDIDAEEGVTTYGVGVGGYRIKTRMIEFRSITVGPFKADDAQAFVIDHRNSRVAYDGLLGMDFLRYLSYEIDYENQTIHWQP